MGSLRVAYAGHDFFSSCLSELAGRSDVDVVMCLTEPPGGVPAQNVVRMAGECGAKILTGRPSGATIEAFNAADIDLLVCAAYMHRIPISSLSVKWAVNIHPTLLPEGRGDNPLPYLVSEHRDLCGISIHEMTMELDRGPLLLQEKITLDERDGANECYLKVFAKAPLALNRFLDDIDGFYSAKRELGEGSYWRSPPDSMRSLRAADATVEDVLSRYFQFGMFGISIEVSNGNRFEADRVIGSRCEHSYAPGSVVGELRIGTVIAVTDGLVSLGSTRPVASQ